MAIKREIPVEQAENVESVSSTRAKQLFNSGSKAKKEKMVLTTFSIEPSFKEELEEMFYEMGGLGWAAGVRFALKEFYKKYKNQN